MNCTEARQVMVDRLVGAATNGELERHMAACDACRQEWEQVSGAWNRMSSLPEEEPSPMVRARFYQMLEAYEEGRRAAERKPVRRAAWWWPRHPAIQFAVAACLLVVGIFAGSYSPWEKQEKREVAQLRSEVDNMRQLVALSLLQQQSASDRLRGVTYSYRVSASDTEVLSALLHTVNTDQSVNVRLAAVDALKQFANSPVARNGIAQALPKQESPLVQVALIDAIRDLRDTDAITAVQKISALPDVDPSVRQRAEAVAAELGRLHSE